MRAILRNVWRDDAMILAGMALVACEGLGVWMLLTAKARGLL